MATAVVLAVVAGSCGDDDDTGGEASVATTPAGSAPSATGSAPATASVPAGGGSTTAAPDTTAPADGAPVTSAMTGNEPVVAMTEIGTFAAPVDLAWRTGDDALYVVEQGGTVQRVAGDETTTVLDLSDLTSANGEQGLLGLTFTPAGDVAYVNYTDVAGDTTISEHPVADDGTFGVGDDARTVLLVDQPYENHNGGDLTFGPDGLLYIGMGDGGAGGDPERRATNPEELLGKLLRIDPAPSGGR
ncbi:MAG TPA: PQQ-dependent sugar dehydrogenase, partial [Ilumatobacteraceae bacterium]|nr:PQQ-dependent sugar dehydrogenase [Ilumatobacteraceae bacterium]